MKKATLFILASLFILSFPTMGTQVSGAGNDISLPEPQVDNKVNLTSALKARKSTRSFQAKEISLKDLSTILWAANGVNRENGKRTAPSAFGKYFINIYVASDQGVYSYIPEKHLLKFVNDKNIKAKLGGVGKTASHVLVFTAQLNELPFFVGKEERVKVAYGTGGCIGENVYLMTSDLNLGTCLMSSINEKAVHQAIPLGKDETPLYIMPLGYPNQK
jgi:SagB-type dehydrogenase family enzyme